MKAFLKTLATSWLAVLMLAGLTYAGGAIEVWSSGGSVTSAAVLAALTGQNITAASFTETANGTGFTLASSTGRITAASGRYMVSDEVNGLLSLNSWGIESDGIIHTTATGTAGSVALSSGTQTVVVFAGVHCVCDDITSATPIACKMTVSSTTATITVVSGGTDTVSYICL